VAKEDFKNRSIKITNLLQCSSSLENKRSYKWFTYFNPGYFQALSWYHPNTTVKYTTVL